MYQGTLSGGRRVHPEEYRRIRSLRRRRQIRGRAQRKRGWREEGEQRSERAFVRGRKREMRSLRRRRPVGQVVKTAASHAANGSSTLPRVTTQKGLALFRFRQGWRKLHIRASLLRLPKKNRFAGFSFGKGRPLTGRSEYGSIWQQPITIVGVFSGEGPPVPIPNTEVKLTCAEDTCLETDWENRSMPTQEAPHKLCGAFRFYCDL